jgi:hypothetical protein
MDGCDFYDIYVGPLNELELDQLAKLADYTLPSNWFMTQEGPEHTADLIADMYGVQLLISIGSFTMCSPDVLTWFLDRTMCLTH